MTYGLLVLADGTLVLGARDAALVDTLVLLSAAGATLQTRDVSVATMKLNRIALNTGDTAFSVWVWQLPVSHPVSGVNRYKEIQLSDGTILATFDINEYESGQYGGPATATPTGSFGPSFSCPFLIMRAAAVPPGAPFTVDPIRRLRQSPHLAHEGAMLYYGAFELDLETGRGLSTGQGSDPQIMLQWSDDGGHTWSNEHWVSAGKKGQYSTRARWLMLGRGRNRVFRVVMTDPVPWHLLDAFVRVTPGTS